MDSKQGWDSDVDAPLIPFPTLSSSISHSCEGSLVTVYRPRKYATTTSHCAPLSHQLLHRQRETAMSPPQRSSCGTSTRCYTCRLVRPEVLLWLFLAHLFCARAIVRQAPNIASLDMSLACLRIVLSCRGRSVGVLTLAYRSSPWARARRNVPTMLCRDRETRGLLAWVEVCACPEYAMGISERMSLRR
jgi:hypothetical protein